MSIYLLIYLLTPPCIPLPLPVEENNYHLAAFAYKMDLIIEREINSYFVGQWAANVDWTRRTFHKVIYYPPSTDRFNFPCQEYCNIQMLANSEYRKIIEHAFYINRFQKQELLNVCNKYYYVWNQAGIANGKYSNIIMIREALQELLKTLGPEDYYSGRMPSAYPLFIKE